MIKRIKNVFKVSVIFSTALTCIMSPALWLQIAQDDTMMLSPITSSLTANAVVFIIFAWVAIIFNSFIVFAILGFIFPIFDFDDTEVEELDQMQDGFEEI